MRIFKNKSFSCMWIGNAVSELGGAVGAFCNSLLIYELTGSPMALGSMWLVYFLPSLVLQLFIGPYIDKWSRKKIMVFSLWSRGIIFLIPLIGYLTNSLIPWHIYAVQILVGLISPFYSLANQVILPTIVSTEQLSTANAYTDGIVRFMTFCAPVMAGIIIEYGGIRLSLSLVCLLFIASGCLLGGIHEKRTVSSVRKTWAEQFIEGSRYFFQQKTIVWLGIFLAFVQFGVGVAMVINIPYITDVLHGNYTMYGYFMAGFPLGYVIGTLLVGKIILKSRRVLMLGSLMIGGLTYINLGMTSSIVFAVATEVLAGIVMAVFNVNNLTISQQIVPERLMGKVFSVRSLIIRSMMPLGVAAGGVFSELWGIRPLYIGVGSIISIVSLLGILLPYFKFIDSEYERKKMAS
ncbi:MFS transporter [Niallia sp. NCCP-28]|uniref:MFS transporter n=1 Tax=Niallia sp. NCCP-28 TaxID=2934712 RepID=UPI002089448D|nr:MFS transporter [Niallia sp. NCCP-28]GKU83088.1 MFS transporter [Niallia sp. NCCP-28]